MLPFASSLFATISLTGARDTGLFLGAGLAFSGLTKVAMLSYFYCGPESACEETRYGKCILLAFGEKKPRENDKSTEYRARKLSLHSPL